MNGAPVQPNFLTLEHVVYLQQQTIAMYGGTHGIRDQGMLESAIQQPQIGVMEGWLHKHPFEMAAAYGFHLARNHAFLDGNKRIAWIAARSFLWTEGYSIRASNQEATEIMLDVAQGKITKEDLAMFLTAKALMRPRRELRDFFARLTFDRFRENLIAIATSYHSGGPNELTAIISDAAEAMPVLNTLANLYLHRRSENENAIHFMQVLCALHRIAEEDGYEW